jgi:protein-L-isoaspartate(D-aspartate) O-methyltransferase
MTNTAATFDAGPRETNRARKAMIDSQLRTSGVNDEYVLERMMAVPREDFLPLEKAPLAYIDRAIALADGAMAAPVFYGKLLAEAAPMRIDRALIVDGGSGYLPALLRPMVGECVTIVPADAARGAGEAGTLEGGFTLLLIDGAIEQLPETLVAQLADDARVVSGIVLRQVTRLAVGRKIAGRVALRPVEDLGIPILHQFNQPKGWSFA